MKTPKRKTPYSVFVPCYYKWEGPSDDAVLAQRWKRKNRIAQLKRTIARLTEELTAESRKFHELWRGEHLKDFSPEWEAFMILRRLKTPAEDATSSEKFEYWITLRKVGELALNAACLAAKAYGKATEKKNAACTHKPAENGQQTNIPPTTGTKLNS